MSVFALITAAFLSHEGHVCSGHSLTYSCRGIGLVAWLWGLMRESSPSLAEDLPASSILFSPPGASTGDTKVG